MSAIRDIILKPPEKDAYDVLKAAILQFHTPSNEEMLRQLLARHLLGDTTSSRHLARLRSLAGPANFHFDIYYELLVDSRRLQLINPVSNIKLTGLKARTDVHRITGLMPDIPVDFQTLIARFSTLTKPIEDLTLVTDRVAHCTVTKRPPVTA
ncbi:unnamed protein product [Echinostoma caproni]|uniref:DUF7041 domain-containing protein n=1 Tax=Echinostoma caproni TaxID=27848 RepID=A0A183BE91_9TREM|nr:unnamed protein product [Echinostoma caproni]